MARPKGKHPLKKKPIDFELLQAAGEKQTALKHLQRQNDIITLLLEGKERDIIKKFVINKYKVSLESANVYIAQAAATIKNRKNYEINNLISLHIYRYEYIYQQLYTLGAWHYAGMALKAKEKLLGFHKQGFHMKVTQGEIAEVQQKTFMDENNLDKLNEEQKNRLGQFLDKMKVVSKLKTLRNQNDYTTE